MALYKVSFVVSIVNVLKILLMIICPYLQLSLFQISLLHIFQKRSQT